MKRHLQCAEQQKAASNFSKYCAWNVIYNARSNRHHPPTSPNTAPATQNESHDWSISHMKRHLQCAEQQSTPFNLTKSCACHAKWISWLIHITYETSFTMRGATGITLQPHQILRRPRKMNLMIDPHHIWNVIYNARSNSQHPPTSPNTAPATQNDHPTSDRNLLKTAETSFPMRDRSEHDPRMIRPRKRKPQPAAPQRLLFALARSRFYWKLQRFPLRLSFQISPHAAPATKSDTWTSPNAAPATQNESHDWSASQMKPHLQCAEQQTSPSNLTKYCACHAKWSVMIDPHHIWNVNYNALSNRPHPPTSANTAPATPNESHDWSISHMKRRLHCAEQQASTSNLTKYCACHAKGISWLIRITYETSFTMRGATGINLQPHQILRLPRKRNVMIDPHHIWNAHLQCAEQQASHSNLTKYCAGHAKWISWLIHITYETSFTMRGATVNTLQPHQILRLPRKMNLMIDPHHIWNVIYY